MSDHLKNIAADATYFVSEHYCDFVLSHLGLLGWVLCSESTIY